MKLVTYRLSGAEHVGALTADGKGVLPLPAADMNTLIETMTLADMAKRNSKTCLLYTSDAADE